MHICCICNKNNVQCSNTCYYYYYYTNMLCGTLFKKKKIKCIFFFVNTFFNSYKFNLVLWHKRSFVHFLANRFYTSYCTFRRSFKDKCPLNGDKTRVQYVNPGTFLLRLYRYVLLCFYYVASGTYCGRKEFKYLRTVIKNVCSIMLEICPTLNPTLNLPDCVDKCKLI